MYTFFVYVSFHLQSDLGTLCKDGRAILGAGVLPDQPPIADVRTVHLFHSFLGKLE